MVARHNVRQDGFTYVGLIVLISVIGMVTAAAIKIDSLTRRAEAEQELLDIGLEFSSALRSYAAATPAGQPDKPGSLNDLVRDARYPEPRRHLRKIYPDPITRNSEWGIVYVGGRIVGIHSLSMAQPLKIANFGSRFQGYDKRKRISEWIFTASGVNLMSPDPSNVRVE